MPPDVRAGYEEYVRSKWFEIQSNGAILSVAVSWSLLLLECILYFSHPELQIFRLFALHALHNVSELIVDRATRHCGPAMIKPLVLLSFLVMAGLAGEAAALLDTGLSVSFFWSLVFFISAGLSLYPQKPLPGLLSIVVVCGVFLRAYFSVSTLPNLPLAGAATFFLASCAVATFGSSLFYNLLQKEYLAREQSELAREQLHATLQAIGDGVVTTDSRGKVVYFNPMAQRMTGLPFDSVHGRAITEVLPWLPVHDLDIQPSELQLEDRQESPTWLSVTLQSSPHGELLISFQDITARKEAEQSRILAARMEPLSHLAGEIAHNFNNILTVVQGRTSLMRESNHLDQELSEGLELIEKATVEAEHLVTQLLTFSPGGAPVKKVIALPEIIEDSLRLLLAGTRVNLQCQFAPDLLHVRLDSQQFQQVLRSLALNALEAMPDGGRLLVSAENLKSGDDGSSRWVSVRLSDNGPGIDAETLSQVVEPYFTTKPGGLGLGLTAANSIIRRHGGRLKLESIPDEGTTIVLELPGETETAAAGDPPGEPLSRGLPTGGKVLIMDDEEPVRKVIGKMLERLGFEWTEAESGEQAIAAYKDALQTEPFRFVILDLVVVNGMGGERTLLELKRLDPQVVAVVASGYANEPVMANFQDYGFKARLPKPFGLKELRECLADALIAN